MKACGCPHSLADHLWVNGPRCVKCPCPDFGVRLTDEEAESLFDVVQGNSFDVVALGDAMEKLMPAHERMLALSSDDDELST